MSDQPKRKRKNYPGDLRVPGTKDYALILTNLMSYTNQLATEKNERKVSELLSKASEKLQELGFKQASKSLKTKSEKPEEAIKKMDTLVEKLNEHWRKGKEKHEAAKEAD